jgi:tyrosine-protein phosphatase SIW14
MRAWWGLPRIVWIKNWVGSAVRNIYSKTMHSTTAAQFGMKPFVKWLYIGVVLGVCTPGFAAEKGLVNFSKVNDSLYRGAQPNATAMRQLQAMGIKSIISLRMTNEVWIEEPALAAAASMSYTNIPLDNLSAPTDAQTASVLAAIESMPKPVFIHCQFGCDRTGTMIACYRIRHDQWPNLKAMKEALAHGFSPAEVGMQNYIMTLKK